MDFMASRNSRSRHLKACHDADADVVRRTAGGRQPRWSGGGLPAIGRPSARRRQYHELFDARLMEARHVQGLPVAVAGSLDDLAEPARTRMEDAYLAACREVGDLFLAAGRVREAWMYLRPVGDRQAVADALAAIPRDAENYEEIIEVALYEGVCPRSGFEYVLAHYGTCNAITLFDGQMHGRPKTDRQQVAALLVRASARRVAAKRAGRYCAARRCRSRPKRRSRTWLPIGRGCSKTTTTTSIRRTWRPSCASPWRATTRRHPANGSGSDRVRAKA